MAGSVTEQCKDSGSPCIACSLSLLFSFFDAWQHFAAAGRADQVGEEDKWAIFLEDNAEWNPSLHGRPAAIQARHT